MVDYIQGSFICHTCLICETRIEQTKSCARVWLGVHQCSQEPHEVIHIALCTAALQSNLVCASTFWYVLSTHATTCAVHCNCCWFYYV